MTNETQASICNVDLRKSVFTGETSHKPPVLNYSSSPSKNFIKANILAVGTNIIDEALFPLKASPKSDSSKAKAIFTKLELEGNKNTLTGDNYSSFV